MGNRVQAERGGQCGPGEICQEGQCQDPGLEPQGGKDGQRGAYEVSATEAEKNGTLSKILLAGGFCAAWAHLEILLLTVMLPVWSVCLTKYLASQSDFEMEATERSGALHLSDCRHEDLFRKDVSSKSLKLEACRLCS